MVLEKGVNKEKVKSEIIWAIWTSRNSCLLHVFNKTEIWVFILSVDNYVSIKWDVMDDLLPVVVLDIVFDSGHYHKKRLDLLGKGDCNL